jgi:A118 family predicted phage portal protein
MKYDVSNITGYLKSLGHTVLDADNVTRIKEWIEWYRGELDTFHKYQMFNGLSFINKKRASLRMPKRVSEEWASLLYNDKVCITIDDKNQVLLDDALASNRFDYKFSELIERVFALGIGATVVFADAKGKPRIDYIIAPMVFPLRQENGEITDCAFGSIKGDACYVNIHMLNDDGSYTIENHQYKKQGEKYEEIKDGSMEESYTSPVKMFQIYKPNIANNIDLFSPCGLSVYANAIDQNKTIDIIYDSFCNEFLTGKKKQFVKTDVLTYKFISVIGKDGEQKQEAVPIFDPQQTEFFALPGEEGEKPITEINPELRVTEHIDALQTALNLFGDACGLGPDRFVFRDGKVYTNSDQVISTQSKLYKNITNHEKILRYSMIELVRAIMYVIKGSEYKQDVTIDFDDSIIEDSEKTRQQALLELNNELIDAVQYYIDVYKMTEEQAIEFRDKLTERTPKEEPEDEPPEGA